MSRRCAVTNRSGKACGAWSIRGKDKCAFHLDPERAAQMGSKHGRRVVQVQASDLLIARMNPPKTAGDVRDALATAMAHVNDQKMDTKTATAMAYIATTLLRAIELSDLESRLVILEGAKEDGDVS